MRAPRVSVAGLMGVVLVAALGLAALRYPSPTLAGVLFLLVFGALGFAAVGAFCAARDQKPWWLGFLVFGGGYLALSVWAERWERRLPTIWFFDVVNTAVGRWPAQVKGEFGLHGSFEMVGHGLWALAFAGLGGLLARVVFPPPPPRSGAPDAAPTPAARRPWRRWAWPVAAALVLGALTTAALVAGLTYAPGLCTGVVVLGTWGLLGVAILGAVGSRGRRRAAWLGAALFGVGYMTLVVPSRDDFISWPHYTTNSLLDAARRRLPPTVTERLAASDAVIQGNARVLKALEMRVPMTFPQETPLQDVLRYVTMATGSPDGPGVPIYVDPVGLQEAEKTLDSPVSIDVEGIPLRTTLRLALRQLGLGYEVRDGLLHINSESTYDDWSNPAYEDPFLTVGQCVLALLAAGFGALLGPLVRDRRAEPDDGSRPAQST